MKLQLKLVRYKGILSSGSIAMHWCSEAQCLDIWWRITLFIERVFFFGNLFPFCIKNRFLSGIAQITSLRNPSVKHQYDHQQRHNYHHIEQIIKIIIANTGWPVLIQNPFMSEWSEHTTQKYCHDDDDHDDVHYHHQSTLSSSSSPSSLGLFWKSVFSDISKFAHTDHGSCLGFFWAVFPGQKYPPRDKAYTEHTLRRPAGIT